MRFLLLTRPDGFKQLVNMSLVSEAILTPDCETRLVVPSAAYENAQYINVMESPETIFEQLR